MTVDHIVIQAGGKGTRLGHLTANKPKALVPVENLPMLFHLFRQFPDKRFIVIADHHGDVLRKYLASFAEVEYQVVDASGTGTCGGVAQALELLPPTAPFMLVWSDLILPTTFELPKAAADHIGISQTFECRWSYTDGVFAEERSAEHGVAGLFVLRDRTVLEGVPESGELVRWMQQRGLTFSELGLAGTREFGLLAEYEALPQEKVRPFNRMTLTEDRVVKEGIDEQGRALAADERAWYEYVAARGLTNVPTVYGTDPLTLERIHGGNVYEYGDLSLADKRGILARLVDALKELHALERVPADSFSLKDAYFAKTMARLARIRDLVPFADQPTITVNGRVCRNVFFHQGELERALDAVACESFAFIHGDCTFSNLMLRDGTEPVLIDPRGYFGHTKLYGDPNYDWAKLFYSVVGNYDRFNLREFRLGIGEHDVTLDIVSNRWEELEDDFFALSGADPRTIKLLHAVIWLSLTTYAWQDYDSVCGAFYNGLYHLEEALG
ncbi:phosphotransferase [Nocardioides nematodiphilus]|uniref:phosphotransferase n=1 Tax=Nocardioides nematodiphilus TaxID=2849669 RepID=UPI001CD99D61|nr:phosphotransferase [Nocardioides nematodiphilus]MCA1984225.1 NTP transferase domain-containing protein [Nocardioides nematodiphilus]